jgi:hypothetical protein
MSTTDAAVFTAAGLPYPTATELARQIDGTANADYLVNVGVAAALAVELARQMTAGTGNVNFLMALGVNPLLATAIKTAIDA